MAEIQVVEVVQRLHWMRRATFVVFAVWVLGIGVLIYLIDRSNRTRGVVVSAGTYVTEFLIWSTSSLVLVVILGFARSSYLKRLERASLDDQSVLRLYAMELGSHAQTSKGGVVNAYQDLADQVALRSRALTENSEPLQADVERSLVGLMRLLLGMPQAEVLGLRLFLNSCRLLEAKGGLDGTRKLLTDLRSKRLGCRLQEKLVEQLCARPWASPTGGPPSG